MKLFTLPMEFADDLYDKNIIDDNSYKDLQDIYEFSKDRDYSNEKDDFDIEI